jgi:predicted nucleotidyltransferase
MVEPLKSNREAILRLAAAHGARKVRVFGSVARGTATPASDIDLLVEMESGRSQLDLIALWQGLEDLLARKVDLITDGGLSPYLRELIEAEARPL